MYVVLFLVGIALLIYFLCWARDQLLLYLADTCSGSDDFCHSVKKGILYLSFSLVDPKNFCDTTLHGCDDLWHSRGIYYQWIFDEGSAGGRLCDCAGSADEGRWTFQGSAVSSG